MVAGTFNRGASSVAAAITAKRDVVGSQVRAVVRYVHTAVGSAIKVSLTVLDASTMPSEDKICPRMAGMRCVLTRSAWASLATAWESSPWIRTSCAPKMLSTKSIDRVRARIRVTVDAGRGGRERGPRAGRDAPAERAFVPRAARSAACRCDGALDAGRADRATRGRAVGAEAAGRRRGGGLGRVLTGPLPEANPVHQSGPSWSSPRRSACRDG